MIQYLITALKIEKGVLVDLWDLYTYDDMKEALEEAKEIAEGASPTCQALKGFTDIVVTKCKDDYVGNCLEFQQFASFKVK